MRNSVERTGDPVNNFKSRVHCRRGDNKHHYRLRCHTPIRTRSCPILLIRFIPVLVGVDPSRGRLAKLEERDSMGVEEKSTHKNVRACLPNHGRVCPGNPARRRYTESFRGEGHNRETPAGWQLYRDHSWDNGCHWR
jgi:hypothetical protein